MSRRNRISTYLDPDIYLALRRRAMTSGESFQDLVQEAVRLAQLEDAEDRKVFSTRASEETVGLGQVLQRWESDG